MDERYLFWITIISLICAVIMSIFGCYDNDSPPYYQPECQVGDIVCENNKIKICNLDEYYETYQDCNIINKRCSVLAYDCAGYVNNACCVE